MVIIQRRSFSSSPLVAAVCSAVKVEFLLDLTCYLNFLKFVRNARASFIEKRTERVCSILDVKNRNLVNQILNQILNQRKRENYAEQEQRIRRPILRLLDYVSRIEWCVHHADDSRRVHLNVLTVSSWSCCILSF